jgi:hypothetical protein
MGDYHYFWRSGNVMPAALMPLVLGHFAVSPPLSAQPPVFREQSILASRDTAAKPVAAVLAFKGVTIIDITDGRLVPGQTVVVAGNRVQAVGSMDKVRVPVGAYVVDARGKYLIPGLWDMHAHTEMPTIKNLAFQDSLYRKWYPAYIAHGVTGLREMVPRFPNGADSFLVWQRDVMDGKRVGPHAVGPSADLYYKIQFDTPADAARIMDSLNAAGMAFVKWHDPFGNRKLFFAAAREARRAGLPFVGHVPRTVTNVEAADSGLRSIEHVGENHQCWDTDPTALWDSVAAEQRCGPVVNAYLRNGTWVVPTLVVYSYVLAPDQQIRDKNVFRRLTFRAFPDAQRFVRMVHRLGVRNFLVGTDCAAEVLRLWGLGRVCHRGLSVLEELGLLVGSGLTPLEALQAATLNPAKFFGITDSLGTIAPNKLADLVLLDANPLADIYNVMSIRAVVANGRYFDRATLDTLDPEGVELTQGLRGTAAKPGQSGSTAP